MVLAARTARRGLMAPFADRLLRAKGAAGRVPTLPDWAVQVLQVVTILALAPLVSGLIARGEAIIQQRQGPRVLQPYYDIAQAAAQGDGAAGAGRVRCSARRRM